MASTLHAQQTTTSFCQLSAAATDLCLSPVVFSLFLLVFSLLDTSGTDLSVPSSGDQRSELHESRQFAAIAVFQWAQSTEFPDTSDRGEDAAILLTAVLSQSTSAQFWR